MHNDNSRLSLDEVFSPIEAYFESQYNAANTAKRQYFLGTFFGILMLVYWGLAMLWASLFNILRFGFLAFLDKATAYWVDSIRRRISLPALFRTSHGAPIQLWHWYMVVVPTRGQSIMITIYVLLNLISIVALYPSDDKNPYLTTILRQILRYTGNRTGINAVSQLPLLLLFGSKQYFHIYYRLVVSYISSISSLDWKDGYSASFFARCLFYLASRNRPYCGVQME